MRIGFDAKRLFYNHTGLGNYSRDIVSYYSSNFPKDDIYLLSPKVSKTYFTHFLNAPYHVIKPSFKFLWRFSRMTKDISKAKIDIYHGLSNELPLGIEKNSSVKSIVTIHDLVFLRYPEFYKKIDRNFYKLKTKKAVHSADLIIAISESTKRDLIELLDVDQEKIKVVYQSCNKQYFDVNDKIENEKSSELYFMYVGSVAPRKNLKIVIEAINEIKIEHRSKFYIVGKGGKYKKQLQSLVKELLLEDWIIFKNDVSDTELKVFYKNAMFTIYPSLYEGFGIPILESQLLGTPTITSNISSMPEVICRGSLLIDPFSRSEIKKAIEKLTLNQVRINKNEIDKLKEKYGPLSTAKKLRKIYSSIY